MTNLAFVPRVLLDQSRPMIVFRKGRTKYHAVAARDADIALVVLDSLRGLRDATRSDGTPYPIRKAASFWLNHDFRPVTRRATLVLRGIVARKPRGVM